MYHSYKKFDPEHPLMHCKSCRGVLFIFKEIRADEKGEVAFETRCPHCKKDWTVTIILGDTSIIKLVDH